MVFSSITFLFFFLPAALLAYHCSGKFKNITLLCVSLLFYAWGEGIYLLLMVASICLNHLTGQLIYRAQTLSRAKFALVISLLFNLMLLSFFKYGNFIVANLNTFLTHLNFPPLYLTDIHLPIGISFFTFQAISYNIDVYRCETKPQTSLINIGVYIALFPQLIAGPIVRYRDIAKSLLDRKISSIDFSQGIERFLLGLSKKVLLANPLGLAADKIFALPLTELNSPLTWLGASCYTLQIYYDFSGYSDMAIGLGRMFGFRFLENFNYPYISKSIQEFWHRWHISLSSWFRDYLYIPLGGNKKGTIRTYLNLLTVFLLCGLWHGASWTFVCWGLYHGFFLMLERSVLGKIIRQVWTPARHIITMIIVIVGWVIFRAENLGNGIEFISIMFGLTEGSGRNLLNVYLDKKLITEIVFALFLTVPILPLYYQKLRAFQAINDTQTKLLAIKVILETGRLATLITLTYFTVISLSAGVYNPFIYFRF